MQKHCCPSLITIDDHTDYCLSRQEMIVQLQDETDRLREQRAALRKILRIRRHQGDIWAVGFARPDWPRVAELLSVPELAAVTDQPHAFMGCRPGSCALPHPMPNPEESGCHWPYGNVFYGGIKPYHQGAPICLLPRGQHPSEE